MKCGAEAHQTVRRTFSWAPSWIWVFLFVGGWPICLILSLLLTKKMVVYAPLCHEHRGIFTRRKVISVTLVVLGLGALFGSIALGAALQQPNRPNDAGAV